MKNDLNNTAGRTLAEHMAKLEEVSNFGLSADAAFKQLGAKVFVLEVKTHETVNNFEKLARAQEGAASVAPPPAAEFVGNCRWGNNRTATTVPSGYMSSAYAGSAAGPFGCGDKTCQGASCGPEVPTRVGAKAMVEDALNTVNAKFDAVDFRLGSVEARARFLEENC